MKILGFAIWANIFFVKKIPNLTPVKHNRKLNTACLSFWYFDDFCTYFELFCLICTNKVLDQSKIQKQWFELSFKSTVKI